MLNHLPSGVLALHNEDAQILAEIRRQPAPLVGGTLAKGGTQENGK